ncbi:MAG: hypothetical protein JWN99_2515 [Ilumatobacteraceae bacterium]|nr:hypothetical protein [Ilumatobacteraceae bacterium]
MHEPEPLHGLRVVARPDAIDAAVAAASRSGALFIRIASDDVFVIGASDLALTDPYAIVEPESAFVGWWLTADQVATGIAPHAEWTMPRPRAGMTQLAQGLVAGLPMKLWFTDPTDASPDGPQVLLMVSRGLAHEAQDRLSVS